MNTEHAAISAEKVKQEKYIFCFTLNVHVGGWLLTLDIPVSPLKITSIQFMQFACVSMHYVHLIANMIKYIVSNEDLFK